VATQTIPRDLGLDLRKLPDLTDSATRKRLSPAAIEAVLKITEKWVLKSDDAMLLLGGITYTGNVIDLRLNVVQVSDSIMYVSAIH